MGDGGPWYPAPGSEHGGRTRSPPVRAAAGEHGGGLCRGDGTHRHGRCRRRGPGRGVGDAVSGRAAGGGRCARIEDR